MQTTRTGALLIVALIWTCAQPPAHAQENQTQEMSVTGKLTRIMAIGAETTGWVIELDPATVDGKQTASLEVAYPKPKKLEKLESQRVSATGTLKHHHGVESGDRPVLEITSLKKIKSNQPPK